MIIFYRGTIRDAMRLIGNGRVACMYDLPSHCLILHRTRGELSPRLPHSKEPCNLGGRLTLPPHVGPLRAFFVGDAGLWFGNLPGCKTYLYVRYLLRHEGGIMEMP